MFPFQMQNQVFWVIVPFKQANSNWHFEGT